jgi:hypothetical protein
MSKIASRQAETRIVPLLLLNCALLIVISPSLLHTQSSSNTSVDFGVWLGYHESRHGKGLSMAPCH